MKILFAATLTALVLAPLAAHAGGSNCYDNIVGALGSQAQLEQIGVHPYRAMLLNGTRDDLEFTVAQAVLVKRDLADLDTLEVFLGGDPKKLAVIQKMRDAKQAQLKSLMDRANEQTAAIEQHVNGICGIKTPEAAPPEATTHAEQPPEDRPTETADREPPGGWPEMKRRDDSPAFASDDPDPGMSVVTGIAIGALATGGGGDRHHGGGHHAGGHGGGSHHHSGC